LCIIMKTALSGLLWFEYPDGSLFSTSIHLIFNVIRPHDLQKPPTGNVWIYYRC
jgi:hypothetical protein